MNPPQTASREPRRILLACPQRIGDVLLATPLARSMKRAWPKAELDMLVFQGTEGVLEGNPDIAQVITVPRRSSWVARIRQLRLLWRRYDLAISPLPTDRARITCWAAGRQRIGLLGPGLQERTKALLLDQYQLFDNLDTHTVSMGLRMAEMLGIEPCFEVVPPRTTPAHLKALLARLDPLAGAPFAVLHPYPKYRYKMWTTAAWIALAQGLRAHGLGVVFTGSAEASETAYVDEIARALPGRALNLAGTLSLGETAELIRRARLYVGPDTAVTHIAAATGIPTIALFGPSNPVKWGPWPSAWSNRVSPWPRRGSGRQGNVFLLQGPGECVPCLLEGCEQNLDSSSECLEKLEVGTVWEAVTALLSETK
ncbi:MAG: glycosyltransferase family 9 protein [Sterolibacterium sp.]|nr:glycosyltransferase family 9 protein [Sterolibacterium sp.]